MPNQFYISYTSQDKSKTKFNRLLYLRRQRRDKRLPNYDKSIKAAITYIENNLTRRLTLDRIAKEVQFSKFHFHRIFQSAVGMSLTEYIRIRRLASASADLLYTEERILDIALSYQFDSQESFSRSFKDMYHLPPGKYRKTMRKIIIHEEESFMVTSVKGWFLSGSAPFKYEMGKDYEVLHQGRASGYLKSVTKDSSADFSTMMQTFKADKFKQRRIRLSGFLRTENVTAFAGMWMRVDDAAGDVLQFDNMSNRPIKGNTNWNYYSLVLDVPENSQVISFGIMLSGHGTVWADQLVFTEISTSIPTTNQEVQHKLHDDPINLSFDEDL